MSQDPRHITFEDWKAHHNSCPVCKATGYVLNRCPESKRLWKLVDADNRATESDRSGAERKEAAYKPSAFALQQDPSLLEFYEQQSQETPIPFGGSPEEEASMFEEEEDETNET